MGAKGDSFSPVSLVGVAAADLGSGGFNVLDAGAAALEEITQCSWAEVVAWCCLLAMAMWAAW